MTTSTELKPKATALGEDARDAVTGKAAETAENLRDSAAAKVTDAANAADAAGAEFGAGSLQAQAADKMAQHLEGVANTLRDIDLGKVTNDVSDFARKNPALFIGGAALLGFAATRFLKARDPQPAVADYGDADPWGSDIYHSEAPDVSS